MSHTIRPLYVKTEEIEPPVSLDKNKWDYSTTTGRYRNRFLGENINATRKKIKDGTYKLDDLN